MYSFADDRHDVSVAHGWPLYRAPVDCSRCGGRIHQMTLRADPWCTACLTEGASSMGDAGVAWLWRHP